MLEPIVFRYHPHKSIILERSETGTILHARKGILELPSSHRDTLDWYAERAHELNDALSDRIRRVLDGRITRANPWERREALSNAAAASAISEAFRNADVPYVADAYERSFQLCVAYAYVLGSDRTIS